MSLTVAEARAEILTLLKAAWDAGAGGAPLLYPNVAGEPPATGSWGRASVIHGTGAQASLANAGGLRRWGRQGLVVVEIYSEPGKGLSQQDPLAILVLNAFEGQTTPGAVWFRNVRYNEVGRDGKWNRVNVIADFEYDQIK